MHNWEKMFSWLDKHIGNSSNPLSNPEGVSELLGKLPDDDPGQALAQISAWLTEVSGNAELDCEVQAELVQLLDEAGQPLQATLLKSYLSAHHLQDVQGIHLWEGMVHFAEALSRAYETCLDACRAEALEAETSEELLPLLTVRLLRAGAEHIKLMLMRYMEVELEVWRRMYHCYREAEHERFARTTLFAYSGYASHTSPQHELLRALVLYVSSPNNLSPDLIEVCFRIAGRMASLFDFTHTQEASSEYCVDLAQPLPPRILDPDVPNSESMRYFSVLRALPQITSIIRQHELGSLNEERRFGGEFTSKGKLAALKHLLVYWNKYHPRRSHERRGISANIEVAHSFRVISKLLPQLVPRNIPELSERDKAALAARAQLRAPGQDSNFHPETWTVLDVSLNGLGALLPHSGSAWVGVGSLCGLKAQNAPTWWLGIVRRLKTDPQGLVHAGIETIGRKSITVWLRLLVTGDENASGTTLSSGSFMYDYFPAILLPDEHDTFQNATLILESGGFARSKNYEILLEEKTREIELTHLLAEGEDYELVQFHWEVSSYER